jgi:CubicO group peptidase (beta-lactamase class C family)
LLRADAATRGASSRSINAFIDDIERADLELHGLMIWRDGAVITEGFRWPYRSDRQRILHSVTKSFTACAIGLLVAEGRLALQDRVCPFFPEIGIAEGHRLQALTVEDLLTMRTGHGIEVSGALWRGIETSWITEFFKIPVEHDPGTVHVYSSAASYMLSAIVTRVTGETIHAYLKPRLFEPLGIHDERWDIGPDGFNPGGNGITARLGDALKLGILHAQQGMWNGKRILPAWWIEQAGQPQGDPHYGYHWVIGDGYSAALGVFVQAVFVYPAEGAVIAVMGAMDESKVLLPHLRRHFPEAFRTATPEIDATLAERLAGWSAVPPLRSESMPDQRLPVSSEWGIDANAIGIRTIGLDILPKSVHLRLSGDAFAGDIAMPIDGWSEDMATLSGADLHHGYPLIDAPVVAGARWLAPDRLEMTWHFVESAFRDTVHIRIEGDRIAFDRRVNINSGARAWPTLTGVRSRGD